MLDSYGRALTASPGSYDDGSNDGAIRALISSGDLVKLPFPDGHYWSEVNASGYTYLESGGTYAAGNSDRSGTYLNVTPQDAVNANGGNRITFPVYGTRFGVRYPAIPVKNYCPGFCVDIDGFRYEVRHKVDGFISTYTPYGAEYLWMCPDVLKDHKHIVRISVPGAMVAGTNWPLYLYGIVAEHRPGNGEPITVPRLVRLDSGQLNSSYTAIKPYQSANNGPYARAVRRIDFYNTDTAAHVVNLKSNAGVGAIWEIPLGAAGATTAPLASGSWPPTPGDHTINVGTDATLDGDFQMKADAGSKVNYIVWGSQ